MQLIAKDLENLRRVLRNYESYLRVIVVAGPSYSSSAFGLYCDTIAACTCGGTGS
jgi:hypothetical protein